MWGQAQYTLAAKRFVTRDFAGTQTLLGPLLVAEDLDPLLRTQIWILWAALCDRAFTANWDGAAELRAYMAKEEVWKHVTRAFDGIENVPCSVVADFVDLVARRCSSPFKETERSVESFLSHIGDVKGKQRVVRSYIVEIQALGNSSFDYAVELAKTASCFDDSQRRQVLKEVSKAHKKYKLMLERAHIADENRVIAAMSASQQLQQQQQQQQQQPHNSTVQSQSQSNRNSSLPSSSKTNRSSSSNTGTQSSEDESAMTRQRTPLTQLWRHWMITAIRKYGIYEVIAVILAIGAFKSKKTLLAFGNRVFPWFWAALREAAKMGLTVTYL